MTLSDLYADTLKAREQRLTKAETLATWMLDHRIPHMPNETERADIVRAALGRNKKASPRTWLLALEIWGERR